MIDLSSSRGGGELCAQLLRPSPVRDKYRIGVFFNGAWHLASVHEVHVSV